MRGTLITFYSYKGGVGRTQALANVGTLLSVWGYRVLCVDWDLEAPGLHRYFDRWLSASDSEGLVELITEHGAGEETDWRSRVQKVTFPQESVDQATGCWRAARWPSWEIPAPRSLRWRVWSFSLCRRVPSGWGAGARMLRHWRTKSRSTRWICRMTTGSPAIP
jgi:CobQ/CobB/MinD/ParA nucleotide binding domain